MTVPARRFPNFPGSRLLLLLAGVGLVLPLPTVAAEPPASRPPEDWQVAAPTDVAGLQAIEGRIKDLLAKVVPCTVAVRVGSSQASGVVVTKDGHVLTAGHVVENSGLPVTFTFPDGKTCKGTTLGAHRGIDAGLMKITDSGDWPFVEMGRSEALRPGTWCLTLGHPLGYQEGRPPVVRLGRVLFCQQAVIQTDCALVSGDSGGPLFDMQGCVIGINSRISGLTTMNFHVPVDVYRAFWDRLVKGERWEADSHGKESGQIKSVFSRVTAQAAPCVVRVVCSGKETALGTIVGPDGWILTKASELQGQGQGGIVCRARDGRQWAARVVGVHPQFDLAMLKVEANGLPMIEWSSRADNSVGTWVAVPGPQADAPLALGVVGVPRRRIPPPGGVLGIAMTDADQPKGVRIAKVYPDGAAHKAGLKESDIITHVNGTPVANRAEMSAIMKRTRMGEVVRVGVSRSGTKLEVSAKLIPVETPAGERQRRMNTGVIGISARRHDFPVVLQHDSVVRPEQCGGPLVDLSGKVIGVNIARAGRTETYAIPSDMLLPLFYDLMSGRLAPKPAVQAAPQPNPPKPPPSPPAKPQPNTPAKPKAEALPGKSAAAGWHQPEGMNLAVTRPRARALGQRAASGRESH